MDIQEAIRRADKRFRLFPPGSTVIAAVSGGADSLALLHALHTLRSRKTLDIRLVVASLDHGLRGASGMQDVTFVSQFASRCGLPVVTGTADVRALAAERGHGIEEAARFARYAFLAQAATELGATTIATGHHTDDQAETILMRLLRGTGLDGLAGMGARSPLPYAPALTLVRPMLFATRNMIEAYLAAHGITPRQDATNDDSDYTRNVVRHQVLPVLEQEFPGAARHLAHLGEAAAIDRAFMETEFQARVLAHIERQAAVLSISRAHYRALPKALRVRLIIYANHTLASHSDKQAGFEQVLAADDVLMTGHTGTTGELPGKVTATLERVNVVFRGNTTQI
jgi:tRNA(Ile)-lysidine synthase